MFVFLLVYLFLFAIERLDRNSRFNSVKLERGNLIEFEITKVIVRRHKYREEIGSLGSRIVNRKDREVIDLGF